MKSTEKYKKHKKHHFSYGNHRKARKAPLFIWKWKTTCKELYPYVIFGFMLINTNVFLCVYKYGILSLNVKAMRTFRDKCAHSASCMQNWNPLIVAPCFQTTGREGATVWRYDCSCKPRVTTRVKLKQCCYFSKSLNVIPLAYLPTNWDWTICRTVQSCPTHQTSYDMIWHTLL